MVNEVSDNKLPPLMETADVFPVNVPIELQVTKHADDEDNDLTIVTLTGKDDGDQISFRVPPSMASMFPHELVVNATLSFEVPA